MKRAFLILLPLFVGGLALFATPPTWWSEEGTRIVEEDGEENNYSPANLGQLKHVAKQAMEHLDANLPGGSGTSVHGLVTGWASGTTPEEIAANYAPLNIGQLKAVAKPFYDRLLEFGYNTKANLIVRGYPANWAFDYPWDPQTPVSENYAPANLGQLKMVFSFNLGAPAGELPAWWIAHFLPGQTGVTPEGDPDGDGLTNLEEFHQKTLPGDDDSDDDNMTDGWEVAGGLNPLLDDAYGDADVDRYPNVFEFAGGSGVNDSESFPVANFIVDREVSPSGNIYSNFQAALTQVAEDYSIVKVRPGVYAGTGNAELTISGTHPILLIGESGARKTILDGSGWQTLLNLSGRTVVDGITFRLAKAEDGGAVRIEEGNHAFINCVFNENTAFPGSGGAILQISGSTSVFHSTFNRNASSGDGASVSVESGPFVISKSILWSSGTSAEIAHSGSGNVVVTDSIIRGGFPGPGNSAAAPLLTYHGHIQADSPAIDGGGVLQKPLSDMDGENRATGTLADLGADEWFDTDNDGLPNWWETYWFPDAPNILGSDDVDGDGLTNLQEFQLGSDPHVYYSQGPSGFIPVLTVVSGSLGPGRPGEVVGPFVVRATTSQGQALENAPIYFFMSSGGGKLSANAEGANPETGLEIRTNSSGEASVWIVHLATPGQTQQVTAVATNQSVSASSVTLAFPASVVEGVVAHYAFEENSGTIAHDWSGNGFHGVFHSGVSFTAGWAGTGGIRTNGDNEYMELPSNGVLDELNKGSYTIAVRYRPVTMPSGSGAENGAYHGLVMRYGLHTGLYAEASGVVTATLWYNNYSRTETTSPEAVLVVGETRHFCYVVDRDAQKIRLYVDGELVREGILNTAVEAYNYGNRPWRVGIAAEGAEEWRWCANGVFDDAQFYGRALSAAEVRKINVGGEDVDGDGLPDWWEIDHFGAVGDDASEGDPDGDGLTNLQEYQQGKDPKDYFNGQTAALSIVSGNNQSGPAGQLLPEPLTVEVTGTSGGPMSNAPLRFSVTGSNGQVAASEAGDLAAVQEVRTGSNGRAMVYLAPEGAVGSVNQVQASTITEGEPVSVTFESTVADNYEKPTIRFTGGYQLTTVATGSTVNFAVTVSDPDDRAEKVELYAGDTKVAESMAAPFTTSWTPAVPGRFPMTVRVFAGSVQTSLDAKMLHVSGTKNENLAYSSASGGMAVAFPADTDTVVSLPFQEPGVFAGRARSVGSSTIEAEKSEPWAPGRFHPGDASYVLQILDGPLEGTEYPITGNSETSVTVVGLETSGAPIAGVRFLIRPRWVANEAVPGSLFSPVGSEDIPELKFPDTEGEGIDRPFAKTLTWSSSGWQASPSSSEALLIPQDAWFVARNKSAAVVTWTPIGDVSHVSIQRSVGKELSGPHDTPLALPRPGNFSPVAAGLMSGGLLNESLTMGEPGDILLGFSSPSGAIGRMPDATFYKHMGRFYRLGDEASGDLTELEILNGGTGWIIRRSGPPEFLFNHAVHATP